MKTSEEIIEIRDVKPPDFPFIGSKQFQPSTLDSCNTESAFAATEKLLSFPTIRLQGSISKATWHADIRLAEITSQTGSQWSTMGQVINQKLFTHPEEALYLLEVGSLELTYHDVPLSIQRAHSVLLCPKTQVTLDQYRVYSYLKSNGYKVRRHSSENSVTKYEKQIEILRAGVKRKLIKPDLKTHKQEEVGHSSEGSFDNGSRNETNTCKSDCLNTLRVVYDAWLPSNNSSFKKSIVQLPHYRILVCSHEDPVPTPCEIAHVYQQYTDDIPILSAIVFPDFVTFYHVASVEIPKPVNL